MSETAALILAGGKNKPDMQAACDGQENRALVDLNGRTMLSCVVEAVQSGLSQTGGGRVLVAGDVPLPAGCVAVAGGASLVDTLLSGVAHLAPSETRLLVVTADIPFLTGDAVADFLNRARALGPNVPFIWPIIGAQDCAAKFPAMKRTLLRVKEGTFTGGNIALLDPAFLSEKESVLRAAYARRKSVAALAQMLGPDLLLRLFVSRFAPSVLPIAYLEQAVGRVLGRIAVRALITPYAEIGADVDRPDDVILARKWLGENNSLQIVDANKRTGL